MTISAIHHVQVTVPSDQLDAALHFYRDVLGLAVSPNWPAAWGVTGYWFTVGDREFHVGREDGVDRRATRAHVAFKVDDVAAYRAKLTALGLFKCDEPDVPGYARFHAFDPFGNTIEFLQANGITLDVDRPLWPKVHVSVALLDARGRLLLVLDVDASGRGKWNLPGGHAERGESVVDGAIRELQEETGVAARPTGLIGVHNNPTAVRFVVAADPLDADPKPIPSDGVAAAEFFPLDAIDAMTEGELVYVPSVRDVVAKLRSGERWPLGVVTAFGF